MPPPQRLPYRAYLLRLWKDDPAAPWRASLENPHTGAVQAFANLEKLLAYLNDPPGWAESPATRDDQEAP